MFATIISPFCYLLSFPDLSLYCSLSSGMVSDVCFFDDVSSLNLFSLLCVELLAVGFIRYFISFLMILFLDWFSNSRWTSVSPCKMFMLSLVFIRGESLFPAAFFDGIYSVAQYHLHETTFRHRFFLNGRFGILALKLSDMKLLLATTPRIIFLCSASSKFSVTISLPIWKLFSHTSIILPSYCPFPFILSLSIV